MKLEFHNSPEPQSIGLVKLPEPEFLSYRPDFSLMEKLAQGYRSYQNLLVVGHGGSITSFYGIYHCQKEQAKKRAYFLNTVDPDYIFELKQNLTPKNTLVVAVSKSGENITHMEMLSQFVEYSLLIITSKSSPLRALGEKLGARIVNHPDIGGRFTGMTEVALMPAAICGLDFQALFEGASHFYSLYQKDNLAFKAASIFFELEKQGFVDVFMPFYSHNLYLMSALIVQLCHESFGKGGKGQTYFAHESPESQHHTNQRFFGGQKNICSILTTVGNFVHKLQTNYPASTHSVPIRGRHLGDINKISLQKAMEFEALGTMEDARIQGLPFAHLSLDNFSCSEIGQFVAFWQLYAVYSSVLRRVDPFDQPQVEASKLISFSKRLRYKGLL